MDELTVAVVALKPHVYDGQLRNEGDEYQAIAKHLPVILTLGWARKKPSAPPGDAPAPEPPKPRNRYKRRDLRPEK